MPAISGWKILRGAASRERCDAAAARLKDVQGITESETYTELKPSSVAADIAQEVNTAHVASFGDLYQDLRPKLFGVGKFRSPADDTPKAFSVDGEAFMIVALTTLNSANGMLIFRRSHGAGGPEDDSIWQEEEVELEAGDAVAWRGECVSRRGNGQGGTILFIQYQKTTEGR